MHTITHAAIGSLIAAAALRGNLLAQATCVVGAVLPDVPMFWPYTRDLLSGRPPLAEQSIELRRAKDIAHSAPYWSALGVASAIGALVFPALLPALTLCVGVLSHIIIDRYTHGDRRLNQDDANELHPYQVERRDGWDYRTATGELYPRKRFEQVVLVLCPLLALYLQFH